MGLYNVVRPCVVGSLHYARRTAEPIDVDDKLALPLVAEGALEPVSGVYVAPALGLGSVEPFTIVSDVEPATDEKPSSRRRSSRGRDTDDESE